MSGDSRIYLIRDNGIEQISVDHTLAEDQVGAGAMTPEEANDSELRHVLSSVLGWSLKYKSTWMNCQPFQETFS